MKKILSFLLAAILLASAAVCTTSAAGTLIFSDNFDSGFLPRNWVTDSGSCAFEWDQYSKCIQGYDSAVVLQSKYDAKYNRCWDQFYTSFDFQIRGFDDLPEEEGRTHSIGLWYRDKMESDTESGEQEGAVYTFFIEIESGKATLNKQHKWNYKDVNGITQSAETNVVIAEAQINGKIEVSERAPWYEIGMRVTSGKIECYFDQELVISAEADPNDTLYGEFTKNSVDTSVGSQKSAILFWNSGNWVALDNFEVWTPDYDFKAASITYGDVNSDGKINLGDATKTLQAIAKWEVTEYNAAAADVTADGKVNLSDVTRLLQYIAKWDVVLGPTA